MSFTLPVYAEGNNAGGTGAQAVTSGQNDGASQGGGSDVNGTGGSGDSAGENALQNGSGGSDTKSGTGEVTNGQNGQNGSGSDAKNGSGAVANGQSGQNGQAAQNGSGSDNKNGSGEAADGQDKDGDDSDKTPQEVTFHPACRNIIVQKHKGTKTYGDHYNLFNFQVKQKLANGNNTLVLENSVPNLLSGVKSLGEIKYTEADAGKTFVYTLTEEKTIRGRSLNNRRKIAKHIDFDETVYRIEVSVKMEDGTLKAEPKYYKVSEGSETQVGANDVVFTTRVPDDEYVVLNGLVNLNDEPSDKPFYIELFNGTTCSYNNVKTWSSTYNATSDDEASGLSKGEFAFSKKASELLIDFTDIGSTHYYDLVLEDKNNYADHIDRYIQVLAKVSYDEENDRITTTQYINNGYSQVQLGEDERITFNNYTYKDGSCDLKVRTVLEGRDLKAGEFKFRLDLVDPNGWTRELATATNDADGNVVFHVPIREKDRNKNFTYLTVRMTQVNTGDSTITYDDSAYLFYLFLNFWPEKRLIECDMIHYEKDTSKKAAAAASASVKRAGRRGTICRITGSPGEPYDDSVVFTNKYTAPEVTPDPDPEPTSPTPVTDDPPVRKTISGDAGAPSEAFTFKMTADDPAFPMPSGSTSGTKTETINGAGSVEFGNITFTKPGTYTYHISEVAGSNSSFTYDTETYKVQYVITEEDGRLVSRRTITRESSSSEVSEASFNNVYTAPTDPSVDPINPNPDPDPAKPSGNDGRQIDETSNSSTHSSGSGSSGSGSTVRTSASTPAQHIQPIIAPRTGDADNVGIWLMIAAAAAAAAGIVIAGRKRTEE